LSSQIQGAFRSYYINEIVQSSALPIHGVAGDDEDVIFQMVGRPNQPLDQPYYFMLEEL